jgi:hypothetical protein
LKRSAAAGQHSEDDEDDHNGGHGIDRTSNTGVHPAAGAEEVMEATTGIEHV